MQFRLITAKDKQAIKSYLDTLKEGRRYNVSIKLHREGRSVDQNRLLWLWLTCIADETGNERETLHSLFKQKFLGVDVRQVMGTTTYFERTTTALNTSQFTDYLEQIQAFAATEIGLTLPNPEDQYFEHFYEQYNDKI